MAARSIRIACAAISRRIYAGRVSDDGRSFAGDKADVTSDVLKAVVDLVEPGNSLVVTVDGRPQFEIHVRALELSLAEVFRAELPGGVSLKDAAS